jgi:hypothetical protein
MRCTNSTDNTHDSQIGSPYRRTDGNACPESNETQHEYELPLVSPGRLPDGLTRRPDRDPALICGITKPLSLFDKVDSPDYSFWHPH